jgi:hypothetical protein
MYNARGSTICKSLKLEAIEMTTNSRMENEVWYFPQMEYHSNENE